MLIYYNSRYNQCAYFFLICTLLLVSFSCCFNTLSGHIGLSNTIRESKKRDVFICEYTSLQNPIIISDSVKLVVTRAWLEQKWYYPQILRQTNTRKGYQLVVEFANKKALAGYSLSWYICDNPKRYFRQSSNESLVTDFNELPNDLETWNIIKSDAFIKQVDSSVIIGKFSLKKK